MSGTSTNGNPTIERMVMILNALERAPSGLSQSDLVQQTGLARSTVYRILNSLADSRLLRETAPGTYVFGNRFLELAARVTPTSHFFSLARYLQSDLEALAANIGQSCKISVYENGAIMVVAGATAKRPHALNYEIGEYLPVHAGGASKVLMAYLPDDERERLLRKNPVALTERTITDRNQLRKELAEVRAQGWAEDRGEYSLSVSAFAAPIRDHTGAVIAALSVPFLTTADEALRDRLRAETISGADKLSRLIEHYAG
ncbi:UNVERIFIED_ORG: IclR family transcriptional regulator [Martelella mediterranea]